MITCDQCGKPVRNPIELRAWDDELDEELEASVCGGDCAKAWADSVVRVIREELDHGDGATSPVIDADSTDKPHPGWLRTVEMPNGQSIRYAAHAATDPETVAALDELAKAAYAHFKSTRTESEEKGR